MPGEHHCPALVNTIPVVRKTRSSTLLRSFLFWSILIFSDMIYRTCNNFVKKLLATASHSQSLRHVEHACQQKLSLLALPTVLAPWQIQMYVTSPFLLQFLKRIFQISLFRCWFPYDVRQPKKSIVSISIPIEVLMHGSGIPTASSLS